MENPNQKEEKTAAPFGYKAPFTKRYKSWLKKTGIIEDLNKLKFTEQGKSIWENDSELNTETTLSYLYSSLISSEDNAEVWHFFHHTFLPKHKTFTKEGVANALSMKLMAHNPKHFKKNAPMIKTITRVLMDSYISSNGLGNLNLLSYNNNRFTINEFAYSKF